MNSFLIVSSLVLALNFSETPVYEPAFRVEEEVSVTAGDVFPDTVMRAAEVLEEVDFLYEEGMVNYDAQEFTVAKQRFDCAMNILITECNEEDLPSQIRKVYNKVYTDLCLMQVRVCSLIYGFSASVEGTGSETPPFPLVFNQHMIFYLCF